MEIVWDEPKRVSNITKHRLDFAELTEDFFAQAVILGAKRGRFIAIGRLGVRRITTIFAALGTDGLSVISMRPSSHAERQVYDQEKAKGI